MMLMALHYHFVMLPHLELFPLLSISPRPAFEGPLQPNEVLSKGRRLFAGELLGPESFATDSKGESVLC